MSMIIKKLELQGFKSFAERTKIVFHPGLTAIVGPNGTGKSNLVDAMLWVLGGLRLKSVRGDRTEDVIFNGNAKKPPLNMADAVLTLGSEEEEMVIAHRVFRAGESEYRLNGKTVRLKDIQDELWKHAIGEKEYFVIEQGAIGNFVTSKPTEKRALIEEAAGTAYYKDKKKQAQNKLENTELNLTRLEDIIAEVEKAKNSLQRQAQAANRYRRLRERIRELTSHHYQRKFASLERDRKDAAALYEARLASEQELTALVRAEEKNAAAKRRELWDLEKSVRDGQEKLFGLKSQIGRLENDIERETKRVELFEENKKRSEADGNELLKDVLLLTKELEDVRLRHEELSGEYATRQGELGRLEETVDAARKAKAIAEEDISRLRDNYLATLQELTETKNAHVSAEKEFELLARQQDKLAAQTAEQTRLLEENAARLAALDSQLEGHLSAHKAAAQRSESIAAAAAVLHSSIAEVQSRLAALKLGQDKATYHLQALRKVAEKERGEVQTAEIPGSLGLLADLLTASPENALLVDAFWKDEARSRVVPAEELLKGLPDGLKGSYLLVPVKARPAVPPDVLSHPGVLGLLKSRLEPDQRIKDSLAGFEDAVIVSEILTAVRIWMDHPELNFLTPSGDLLLSSGLLRLGQKAEGVMALAVEMRTLAAEIDRLENDAAPLALRLEELRREEAERQHDLDLERERLSRAERAILDTQKERGFVLAESDKIHAAEDILTRETELLAAEKDSLQASLIQMAERVRTGESEAASLKERVAEQERTLAAAAEAATEAERRFMAVKAGLDLLQEKINSLRHQAESTRIRKETAETKIKQLTDDSRRGDDDKSRLEDDILALRKKLGAIKEELVRSESVLAGAETFLQQIRVGVEETEASLQKARQDEEAAKDGRVQHEIRKAEVDRDLVNLDEMCWQELKKTLAELKAESEVERAEPAAPAPVEETAGEEAVEADEEGTELQADGAPEAERAGALQETAKPRRVIRKWQPVAEMTDVDVEKELEEARETLNRFKAVNLMAEEEYLEQKKRFEFLIGQRQDLRDSITSTQEAIRKIDEESKVQFLKALEEVNRNFQEVFAGLFKGGNAEVKLLEADNPLESGVEIVAQPPGKRVQNLSLLSGGEKSLTSLSFLFALFRYKPSPFCFLDEVDAALDDVNLARFLDLLKTIKRQTQFILITHNYKTMEVADYIYGTTMSEPNITRLLSVKLEKKDGGEILNNLP